MVDPSRWEELIALHAVEALTLPQSRELADELAQPHAASAFRDGARFHRLLAAALAQPSAQDLAERVEAILHSRHASQRIRTATAIVQRLNRRRRTVSLALAALLILGVVLAGFAVVRWRRPDLPALTELAAGVHLQRAGQPSADLVLRSGDRISTSSGATATLRYADGSAVTVSHDARCVVDGAKALDLVQGRLEAVVAHQPSGTSLRVQTPQADIVVVGTRFSLQVTADTTLLSVTQGVVRMIRHGVHADDPPIAVAAGFQLEAEAPGTPGADASSPVALADAGPAPTPLPATGWTENRHGDPILLRASTAAGAVDYAYDFTGPRGYSSIRHDLAIAPQDIRLVCLIRVQRSDEHAILSFQAVTRDGGAWYLGYGVLHRHLGAGWFRFSVPVQEAVKKNSPSGSAPYRPDQVIACTIGISAGAAAISVTPPKLESTLTPGTHP